MHRTRTKLWSGSTGNASRALSETVKDFDELGATITGSRTTMMNTFAGQTWDSNTKFFQRLGRLNFTSATAVANDRGTANELQTGNNTNTMWCEPRDNLYYMNGIYGYNDVQTLLYETTSGSLNPKEMNLSQPADNFDYLKFILGPVNNQSNSVFVLKLDKSKSSMNFTVYGSASEGNFTLFASNLHFNGFSQIVSDDVALWYQRDWTTIYYVNYNVQYTYSTSTTAWGVRCVRAIYGLK